MPNETSEGNDLRLPWQLLDGILCDSSGKAVFGRDVSPLESDEKQRRIMASVNEADGLRKQITDLNEGSMSNRGLAATHRCKKCGALWINFGDSCSLASMECGQCCDNVEMGDQIEPIGLTAENAKLRELIQLAYEHIDGDDAIEESLLKIMLQHPADEAALAAKGGG